MADNKLNIRTVVTVPETDRSSSAKFIACTRATLATCLLSITLAGPAQSTPPTPDSSSPSASLQATKGYGQTILLNDGRNVSFAKIQTMEKTEKEKVLEGMKRIDRAAYKEWETQVAIKEGEKIDQDTKGVIASKAEKLKIQEVAIKEGEEIDRKKQEVMKSLFKEAAVFVSKVEKNESLLKNTEVASYLQKLYDNSTFFEKNPPLLQRIQALMGKIDKYQVQIDR